MADSDEETVRVLAAYKAKEEADQRQRDDDERKRKESEIEKQRLKDVEDERQKSQARLDEILRSTSNYNDKLINVLL